MINSLNKSNTETMHKLCTTLSYFKFNSMEHHCPFSVSWFKLVEEDGETSGECFTTQELDKLINYVSNNKTNFGNQNYFNCDEDNTPYSGLEDILPLSKLFPENVIIRKDPHLNKDGKIYSCMDIELINPNGSKNHNYSLSFDIIGRIDN